MDANKTTLRSVTTVLGRMSVLELLPAHVLEVILRYLEIEDTFRLSRTCSSLYTAITVGKGQLWKRDCEDCWLSGQLSDSSSSWYQQWLQCCKHFGRYRDCYAKVKGAWMKIEEALKGRCPDAYEGVMRSAPISEADISRLEQRLGVELPNEYRCSLRIHGRDAIPLGIVKWYYFRATYSLLGMEGVRCMSMTTDATRGTRTFVVLAEGWMEIEQGGMPQYLCEALLMAVNKDVGLWGSRNVGKDESGIPSGNVVSGYFRECPTSEKGIERCANWTHTERAVGFANWLASEAERIECYHVAGRQLTRFLHSSDCIAITEHFTVRVATAFDPTFGDWQYRTSGLMHVERDTGYGYHIVIEMSASAPAEDACQLTHRFWEIQQDGEPLRIVDGEGVVGYQPVFHPGHRFEYASYNHFQFPCTSCVMSGYFIMKYLNRREEMRVKVPAFRMEQVPLTKFKRVYVMKPHRC